MTRISPRPPATLLAALLLGSVPAPALAVLGGVRESVVADQTHMRASGQAVPRASHTRTDLTLPNGGQVHEFTNAGGQVFAVTWRGPGKPDLRSLLGPHFADLQSASLAPYPHGAHRPRLSRRPAAVNRTDLKIQTGGHMGWFWGVAYLPALAPAGFALGDLQ